MPQLREKGAIRQLSRQLFGTTQNPGILSEAFEVVSSRQGSYTPIIVDLLRSTPARYRVREGFSRLKPLVSYDTE